jgi:predicted Rossmann fold flavoprotein
MDESIESVDLAIVGAGAAGLMAAIHAGREHRGGAIALLEGARSVGAKIRISGGGRCNVTNERVDETSFSGSSPKAIRKILLRLDVASTIEFFAQIGVPLKREETGKLFPVSNDARTVVDALVRAARAAGARLRQPWRVASINAGDDTFALTGVGGERLRARRVILATGGRSVPKTGSDGHGYAIAESLGHTVAPLFPALVPLLLADGCFLKELAGLSAPATLTVRSPRLGKRVSIAGPVLCTHFGISGPATLDISRHYVDAMSRDPETELRADWLPTIPGEDLEQAFRDSGRLPPGRLLGAHLPERLARALCAEAGVDPAARQLTRDERRRLTEAIRELRLPVTGTRGFHYAEVTAGGVPLSELRLETMESRVCPGLHLCGEICDVDGRIGGYNFQWAWASGAVAGLGAGAGLDKAAGPGADTDVTSPASP